MRRGPAVIVAGLSACALASPATAQTELASGIGDQGFDEQNPIALAGDQVVFQGRIAFAEVAPIEAVTLAGRRRVLTRVQPARGGTVAVRFDAAAGRLTFSVHERSDDDQTLVNEVRTGPLAGAYDVIDRCDGLVGDPREVRTSAGAVIHATSGCERRAVVMRGLEGGGFTRLLSNEFPATFLLTTAMAGRVSAFGDTVYEDDRELYKPQGAGTYRPDGARAIQPDGKVVFSPNGNPLNPQARCGTQLAWHSPAEPQPHMLPGTFCGGDIAIAGDRVVALRQAGAGGELVSMALSGGDVRVVARFDVLDLLHSVDTDGSNVVWAEGDCHEDAIWLSRAGDPPKAATPARPCTLSVASSSAKVVRGKALVKVKCPNGCRGVSASVNQAGDPTPPQSAFQAFARAGIVKVPLAAALRRRAGRGRRPFNVRMTFAYTDQLGGGQKRFTRRVKLLPPG